MLSTRQRVGLLLGLVLAVAAFFALDLGRHFSLAALQSAQGELARMYAEHPLVFVLAYMLLYVALFALGLPVGSVMTLAGGALFGFWLGVVVVSFASTLGATAAFLVSRHLLGATVRRRFGSRLAVVDQGVAREGGYYLFTLRLVPLFPPALLSMLFGLTQMRTATFHWVSQAGMLAGTLVYVNAGTQLAKLSSLRGILSPALLASLLLLGVFPLLARRAVDFIKLRHAAVR